jgi:hypothetical protein
MPDLIRHPPRGRHPPHGRHAGLDPASTYFLDGLGGEEAGPRIKSGVTIQTL